MAVSSEIECAKERRGDVGSARVAKDKDERTRSERVHHSFIPSEGFATHELLLDCATFFDVGRGGLLELRDHDAFVLDFGSVRRGSDGLALLWPRRFLLLLVLVLRVDVLVLVVLLLRVVVLILASLEILETAHIVVVVVISRRQVFLVLLLVAIVALSAKDGRPAPLFAVVLGIEDGFSLFPELAGPVFGAAQQSAARLQEAREERGRKKRAPYVDIVLVSRVVGLIEGSPVCVGCVRFFGVVVWRCA